MNPQALLALEISIAVFAGLVLAVVNTVDSIFFPGVEKFVMFFTVLVVLFGIHMTDKSFLRAELFVALSTNMFLLLGLLILIVKVVAVVLYPTSFGFDYNWRKRAITPVAVVITEKNI